MKKYRPLNFFQQTIVWIQIALIVSPASCLQSWAQPVVTQVRINHGDASRSVVTNLAVTFNTNVAIASPNLLLQNLTTGTNLPSTNLALSYDSLTHEATWTFPGLAGGSLPPGNWLAGLPSSAVTDTNGNALIGVPGGAPGDPLAFQFYRYSGDVNGDRDVDFADTYWFKSTWLRASNQIGFDRRFDFSGDGIVNSNDLPLFQSNYFTIFPPQPGIFAALANDTGTSATDSITSDPTISGTVFRTNNSASFRAALTTNISVVPTNFLNVISDLTTNGTFRFSSNRLAQIKGGPLLLGTNVLVLRTVETNGTISSTFLLPFVLGEGECFFPNGSGWVVSRAPAATPGSVIFTNCEAVMTEGDSFTVTLEKSFIIPPTPGLLTIQYSAPTFDSSATNLMRDAFEAALVDASGRPLTFTIQGSASVTPANVDTPSTLPANPAAFFNHSDGKSPFAGPGTAFQPSTLNPQLSTIFADVSHLAANSNAKLILRLVNNDLDRHTTIRIVDVRWKAADPSLNLNGSPPTAFSLLGGGSGIVARRNSTNSDCPPGSDGPRAAGLIASVTHYPTNLFGGGSPGSETTNGDSLLPSDGWLVFTTTADFQRGTLFNVTATNIFDELRLSSNRTTFPVMWIPNTGEDTVSKIDTRTGRETARYRTWFGPAGQPGYFNHLNQSEGAAPSRTAVDRDGNVYVANRHFDNRPTDVIKILAFGGIDRNNNGVIDTSFDANTNGMIGVDEFLPMGDTNGNGRIDPAEIRDERIAWIVSVGPAGGLGRALTLDRDGNIWLGLYSARTFYKLSPDDGHILLGPISVAPHQPYGAVIDGQGVLWSPNEGTSLLKFDTVQLTNRIYNIGSYLSEGYGIAVGNNRVYVSAYQGGCTFLEFNPLTEVFRAPAASCFSSLHLAVDMDGNLLAGPFISGGATKFRPDGSVLWSRPKQTGTGQVRGTVVDSDNNVWQIHLDTSNISKFRGFDGAPLGVFPVGNYPYLYTDATGLSTFTTTSPSGTWTAIADSGKEATAWGAVAISAATPTATSTRIRVRASDSRDALLNLSFVEVVSAQTLPGVRGRFFQVEVSLRSDLQDATPSVQDITVLAVPPPSLVTDAPGTVFAPGATVLLSGQATAAQPSAPGGSVVGNSITHVTLNGASVEALDPAGNYYSAVQIRPGLNTFAVTATDFFGQTTTNTLILQGACPNNASTLQVVSASVQPEYGRTSFNEWTKTLYADLALRNGGTYPVRAPFYVGVTHISDPTVRLLAADGVTADGVPYYDFTTTLTNGTINPQQTSLSRTLAFHNPNKVQFTYELVVLGQLNQAPYFTTAPPLEVIAGHAYTYAFSATDPDGDALTYSLLTAPAGLTNSQTSPINPQLRWTPSTAQIGTHDIRLRADDGKGGVAEQHFLLSVITAPSNRPPYFVSTPVTVARIEPVARRLVVTFDDLLPLNTVTNQYQSMGLLFEHSGVAGTVVDFIRGDFGIVDFGSSPRNAVSIGTSAANSSTIRIIDPTSGQPSATDFFSVRVGDGDGASESFEIRFYGLHGELLQARSFTTFEGTNGGVTVTFSGTPISSVVLQSLGGVSGFAYDDITFDDPGHSPSYVYDADALDPDGDTLTYSLVTAPTNMTINPGTGLIRWGPTAEQTGTHNVTVLVQDGRGGSNTQSYFVCVLPAEGNRPPIIVSTPNTEVFLPPSFSIFQTNVVISYLSEGYRYKEVASGQGTGFEATNYDDSLFAVGQGGFGNLSNCPLSIPEYARTLWNVNTDILLRKRFVLPQGIQQLKIGAAIDNDLQVFINGLDVSGGLRTSGGCARRDQYVFYVSSNIFYPGTNLLAVRGHDYGAVTYVDIQATAISLPTSTADTNYFYLVRAVDPDGDLLSFSLGIAPNGMSVNPTNGLMIWSPRTNQLGTYDVKVVVSDSRGGVDEQTFSVNVLPRGTAEIHGIVFNDLDSNGVKNIPETGLTDWIVFIDRNRNNHRDIGEPFVRTDSAGTYGFNSLPAGTNFVMEEQPPGWQRTAPVQTAHQITLSNDQIVAGVDFGLRQITSSSNSNPQFISSAPLLSTVATVYRYEAVADDGDSDLLSFDLVTHPDGMLVNTNTGVVAWRPLLIQLGAQDVILRVQDGRGGVALQSFRITVIAPNSPPIITSFPPNPAVTNLPYRYIVRAQDAEGQTLTFSLGSNAPAGMSLNSQPSTLNSAVLDWTPALTNIGTNRIEIIVRDSKGAEARQVFDLEVVVFAPNHAPLFTTSPRTQTRIGFPYMYLAEATDADGDPLAFSLVSGPSGMSLTNSQPSTFNSKLLLWTPSGLGQFPVSLAVSDGRASGIVTQQFILNVTSTLSNSAPLITSSPSLNATDGQTYEYDAFVIDPDSDPVTWNLVSGPVGMSIDSVSGKVLWIPTLDQLGTNNVIIEARDIFSASTTQSFNIDVGCVNRPPQISSVPPVEGHTGTLYLYAPRATDPDGDKLSWSFATPAPSGMTINSTNGLIRWTPTTNQVGAQFIRVRVSDGRGGSDTQNYSLYVVNSKANKAPVILSSPFLGATVNRPYTYTLRATDADGDALTLQSLVLPTGATLTPTTSSAGLAEAVVRWTPTFSQLGINEFILVAKDPSLASSAQRFNVLVRSNQPPVITSSPPTNAVPGVTYRYDVTAYDADGDALTYTLTAPIPAGAIIDNLGRLTWTPIFTQVGVQSFTVNVTDSFGATANQSFMVQVAADTQPPTVSLDLIQGLVNLDSGQWAGDLGSTVKIRVNATDNISVASRSLRIGTNNIPLAANGVGSFVVNQTGLFNVIGIATDAANNIGTATRPIQFRDPRATNTVFVSILTPTNNATVTAPTPVIATITNVFDLASYRVDFAPVDLVDLNNIGAPNSAFITLTNVSLPSGTRAINAATLATFDPTALKNDSYVIRVYAQDVNGSGWYEPVIVGVSGNLKFGEFRLEFTDLEVPLAGIPITLSRVYDTRDAQRIGDFGYGWTLGVQGAQIRETLHDGTFYNGTRVYLNTPDGRRVGFTAYPTRVIAFGFVFADVEFKPDAGVFEKLEINGGKQVVVFGGDFLGGLGDEVFDPDSYKLTTRDGTVYEYDQNKGLQRVTDLNGNRLDYTANGIFHYSVGSTTPDQSVSFSRDAFGRIRQVTGPNVVVNYAYDTAGNLRSFTDAVTNTTQYLYSTQRAHYLTNIIDPFGRSALRMEYDATGRLLSITDAEGHKLNQDFDPNTRVATFTDGNGNTNISKFDANGNELVKAIVGISTNYFAYDANNNLLASTNGRGFATNFTYDARGNVKTITDALSNRTTIAYNAQSKPVSVVNALGQTLNLRYDSAGKLVEVVNNAGLKTIVTRDSQGRVASLTDAAGNTTQFDYTGGCTCGKPAKVINPDGSFKLYEYDSLGNATRTINELGAESLSFYDTSGKLLRTRDALSNYTYFYYNGPLLTNIVDALGRSTRYEYDVLNRTNAIIDAQGGVVRFEYDGNGNRTKVIDAVTNVTTFIYDAGNRLIRQIDPLGHTNFFGYDAAGNRIEAIDRNGRRRTFAYDAANRMTNELWWEGTNVVRSIVFGFNELGVQTLAADPAARYEYSYDALNRLERTLAQSAGVPDFTLLYTYTALGQVESVTDNWGVRVGSGYDNRNRLASRTWSSSMPGPSGVDPARVDFAYDPAGNRLRTDRFADLAGTNRVGRTTNAYNRASIVTNITHLGPTNSVLARYDYNFDAAYQITRWAIGNQLSDFAYDRTGQLTNALNSVPGGQAQPNENFHYDANGNRVGAQSGGGYVVGQNNQILSDGTNSYAYDAEGNMTSRSNTVTGVLTTYQFDHRNRLVNVTDRDGGGVVTQTVAFVYDAMNRRLNKTVNGQVTRFLYNQDDSWADLDGTNAVIARYLHGARIDELLARQRASDGRGWYLTDHLGTVRDIANAAGAVVAHVDYSSFGQVLGVSNQSAVDRFLFTGRELDGETGLYFYRARYYSTQLGRFISQDPIRFEAGDFNNYRYVLNSPNMGTDAFGLVALVEYSVNLGKQSASTASARLIGEATRRCIASVAIGLFNDLIFSLASGRPVEEGPGNFGNEIGVTLLYDCAVSIGSKIKFLRKFLYTHPELADRIRALLRLLEEIER